MTEVSNKMYSNTIKKLFLFHIRVYDSNNYPIWSHWHDCEMKIIFRCVSVHFIWHFCHLNHLGMCWFGHWITLIGLKNRACYELIRDLMGEFITPLPIKFSSFWFFIDINALIINTPYYIELSWCVLSIQSLNFEKMVSCDFWPKLDDSTT